MVKQFVFMSLKVYQCLLSVLCHSWCQINACIVDKFSCYCLPIFFCFFHTILNLLVSLAPFCFFSIRYSLFFLLLVAFSPKRSCSQPRKGPEKHLTSTSTVDTLSFWGPGREHCRRQLRSMNKSTLGALGVDLGWFVNDFGNHFGIDFSTFSESVKVMNSLHRA